MNKMAVNPPQAICKRLHSIVAAVFLSAEKNEYLKRDKGVRRVFLLKNEN
jgi:hypothetical protein